MSDRPSRQVNRYDRNNWRPESAKKCSFTTYLSVCSLRSFIPLQIISDLFTQGTLASKKNAGWV
ncbi:MAG: hypothetical protein ACPHF4_09895, partial [Rubripirellula sp.]